MGTRIIKSIKRKTAIIILVASAVFATGCPAINTENPDIVIGGKYLFSPGGRGVVLKVKGNWVLLDDA